ncbi:hypothetical protein GCM10010922_01300 [Microbacterium sorbitolivorans]|uniref:Uncharacterized protein n=1 Tax=Microbacterium sorbitolivorans TaxID=1867410 RepID=A0A367Y741_9MICO|nr:hypothetical protein [Microbacterium sorbitolivorans]RCK61683.1 hypothetical protein DTO57_03385 [Microbacterium sorbitolivorans]GGF30102.1 hypothetical protein GCM10010922_01300 [Microbacterium sorbitolivorans]
MTMIDQRREAMLGATMQIKVYLPVETFRELVGHARERNIEVGELVSRLAVASIKPKPTAHAPVPEAQKPGLAGPRDPITPEVLFYALDLRNNTSMTWEQIADKVGYSRGGLYVAMKKAGLR